MTTLTYTYLRFGGVCLLVLLTIFPRTLKAQLKPEDFGYRHFQVEFNSDTVQVLVKSKKGQESIKKPIFFSVQGSTATPLIVHNGDRLVSVVSLSEGFVEDDFHLVIVGKPGIPLICHKDSLLGKNGRAYKDPITHNYPQEYLLKNNLEYYVSRNNRVIEFLRTKDWVDTTKLVVAGHSEGSTIATYMADKIAGITHLIYSGGLPYYPRIMAMLAKERKMETNEENPWVQKTLAYWQDVVDYPFALVKNKGYNTNVGTYSFSQNESDILKRLNIPVLVCYGTNDEASPYLDMFQIEVIKEKVKHITFRAYVGLNHNYFGLSPNNEIDYSNNYIDKIVKDWLIWLDEN